MNYRDCHSDELVVVHRRAADECLRGDWHSVAALAICGSRCDDVAICEFGELFYSESYNQMDLILCCPY